MDGGKCRVDSAKLELSTAHEFGAVAMMVVAWLRVPFSLEFLNIAALIRI